MATTTSHTARTGADLAPTTTTNRLPLWLALLAIPGVSISWEIIPMGGFVVGVPAAVASIVLARRSRRERGGSPATTAAIVIAAACLLFIAVCAAFVEA